MIGPLYRLKNIALDEVSHAQGFMQLLTKPRNGAVWTDEDRAELRLHLRHLARSLPAFGVFSLPGGSLLLPCLALFLDRRKKKNREGVGNEAPCGPAPPCGK
jgi:hypothetical protein